VPAELDCEYLQAQFEERLTRVGDFYGIPFVLDGSIRLSGRGDSHTMICGHPDNVEYPLFEHAGEFACLTGGELTGARAEGCGLSLGNAAYRLASSFHYAVKTPL
jgi:hypothetical protein